MSRSKIEGRFCCNCDRTLSISDNRYKCQNCESAEKNNLDYTSFGDINQYPVIINIIDILNNNNYKYYKKCASFIQSYNTRLNKMTQYITDKENKSYLLNLIKNDFLLNLDKMNLPNNIYTHMKNLTISIFRYKLSLTNYKKQAQR